MSLLEEVLKRATSDAEQIKDASCAHCVLGAPLKLVLDLFPNKCRTQIAGEIVHLLAEYFVQTFKPSAIEDCVTYAQELLRAEVAKAAEARRKMLS